MKHIILALALVSTPALAGLEKVSLKNLDLDYKAPYGQGQVERVGIGMGLKSTPYPVEVTRTEDSFELTTPYVDFTWKHPLKLVYEIEGLFTRKANLSIGTKIHSVNVEEVQLTTKDNNLYKAELIEGECKGEAVGSFDKRLLEDCRKSMDIKIKRVDVPESFILARLMRNLITPVTKELDIPGHNLILSVKEGKYALQVYIKYWMTAGLRAWGQVNYENNYETIAIRVDQVKFGYIPVTNLVMNKLKEIITSPEVTVDPPWIRIKTRRLYEGQ